MDFFGAQDRARRRTGLLVLYYALAVALIIVGVYLATVTIMFGAIQATDMGPASPSLWNPVILGWVALGTLLIVLSGSAYKVQQLAGGGESVAQLLGGRLLTPSATAVHERRLLNVVEEMSIASGVPMPKVFVLDEEEGINAFAAGYTTGSAVVAVTGGCLRQLSRDELQGVVAHEFSHILNGDMRLNIRLMGVLHGILVVGLIGYTLMRIGFSSGRGRSRSNKKGNTLPIALFGLVVMAIGYIGVFFGRLIQSAVSRQREFLADASAVQFTRNPSGIGGALAKIGGLSRGSRLLNTHAGEVGHFFFANGLNSLFMDLLATHPPLTERIRRIDAALLDAVHEGPAGKRDDGATVSTAAPPPLPAASSFAITPAAMVSSAGVITAEHVTYARSVLANLPKELQTQAHSTAGAPLLLYALLLDAAPDKREQQMAAFTLTPEDSDAIGHLIPATTTLNPALRLPLADLALPALRSLAPPELQLFRSNITALVEADQEISLFEFALQRMLLRQLDPQATSRIRITHMTQALPSAVRLLSCLANWGTDEVDMAVKAFEAGLRELLIPANPQPGLLDAAQCGLSVIDEALRELGPASPVIQRRLLTACVACVGHDGRLTVEESELIRAIADAFNCPLPPLLADQGSGDLVNQ